MNSSCLPQENMEPISSRPLFFLKFIDNSIELTIDSYLSFCIPFAFVSVWEWLGVDIVSTCLATEN